MTLAPTPRQARRRTQPRPALSRSYSATASSIPCARRELVDFARRAGADSGLIEAIELASSEALTNVTVHAYPDAPGPIHLAALATDDDLWVLVGDDGCGLQAARPSSGLGLGLSLIAQVSDEFVIVERSSGGLEVRMRFALAERAGACQVYALGSVASATRPASPRFSTTT